MADPPKELVDAIAGGRALIVCGAGVSRLATGNTAPGWAQLINLGLERAKPQTGKEPAWVRACSERLKPDASTDDWLKAADEIQEKLGGHDGKPYRAFLKQSVGNLKATNSAVFDALRAIGEIRAGHSERNRIATTNYDDLLHKDLNWEHVTWKDTDSLAECLNGDHQAVLHLHGHWREPQSVIFSRRDYERLRGAESAQFLQQLATHKFTLVFIGCSASGLADENVGALLSWFGKYWTGLGKEHYVLVKDEELSAPWEATPVAYGKDYPELAGFLAALAPTRASAPSSALPARDPFPPDPRMIGRRDRLEELLRHILEGDRPIIVPGGPGMGKTTLALAAAHDSRVKDRFGKARIFVNLEVAASAEAVLRSVAAGLGVDTTGATANVLDAIGVRVSKNPTLAILDNLETPWHAEPVKTEEILGQLAAIEGLLLLLTVRGETPMVTGGTHRLGDIERLGSDDAKELFLRVAGKQFETDAGLSALLTSLDGHPLSIVLMAAQTDGRHDLSGLAQEWQTRRAAVLARGPANDRLTSVRVSLGLSLDRLVTDAKRLLGLVALLPTGLQSEDIDTLLPEARADAARVLEKARLVEIRHKRLTMLAPLRATTHEEKLATHEAEGRLIEHFVSIAADGSKIGTNAWPTVRDRVTREAGNLDAVCLLALGRINDGPARPKQLEDALQGLGKLNQYGLPAEVSSLQCVRALPESEALLRLRANAVDRLGDIALARSDHDAARAHFEEARSLYERVGSLLGQANCTKSLGDIALARSDHDTARVHYEKARPLYERVGSLLGQANCIQSIGDLALRRSDHDTARTRYEEARPLYERVGSLLGQGICIARLGQIALEHSDLDTARTRYEEARPLFERIGDLRGQANCIRRLGDIALGRSDHDAARARYEEARPLYERVGDLRGQANCIKGLGDIALNHPDHDTARACYEEALGLYVRIPDPFSIGFAHLDLMQVAASDADRERHREAVRAAWASIGRQDLIAKHLDAS
jgi:tetratricopeptide (TPR) repeat protein